MTGRHFWFGPDRRPLAGVLHPAAAGAAREVGVVICKPFGIELLCTHRAHRHLAIQLAGAGFPTLRFDYDGTGDSAGSDLDPDRVEAWSASIGRAVEELRARTAVERVCLVGAGFGALLAAAFAGRDGVDSLALFGPSATGRAWLRQARAFQLLKAPRGAADPVAGEGEEIVGFHLAVETVEALRKLEAAPVGARGPRSALIIPRDDLPGGEERLVERLRASGADVTVTVAPGFGAMMRDDPHVSVVPTLAWDAIVSWLVARSAVSATARDPADLGPSRLLESRAQAPLVRETFAELAGLFCVAAEPTDGPVRRATILLLNVGANPHLGVNRMYVDLARIWAQDGFRVVRIDLAGIGETPAAPGARENHVYAPSAVEEIRAAMDAEAKTHGARRFVLMGLCSGAYTAFKVGVADERVAGVVLINPLTFHWNEGDSLEVRRRRTLKSRRYYARAALERDTWRRLLRGELHVRAVTTGLVRRMLAAATRAMKGLTSDVERGFRSMDQRGVEALLVFGAEDGGIDVIEEHLGSGARRMRRARHFAMVVLDGPDHTFTALHWQRHLATLLRQYLRAHFGGDA